MSRLGRRRSLSNSIVILVGDYGNCCCFALTRGFERLIAATSETRAAHDTDASASCKGNKVDATGGITTDDKTTYSLQWTGHGTLCCVPTSDVRRPHMTCSKKTRRQRHKTLVIFTQASFSQFSQPTTKEMRTPGWVKEARIPDSDEKTCLTTVYAAHVPSGFLSLDDRKRETTSSYSNEKSIAVEPVARPPMF